MFPRKLFAVGLLAAAFAPAGSALAATSTANMNVSIQITAGCNISVTNINFGSQAASVLASALPSTAAMGGLFTYTCAPQVGVTPVLSTNTGLNPLAGVNRMKGALATPGFIPYSLNLPANLTAATGSAQTFQIIATIPAQATLPNVDSYTDTVVLTLTY